MARENQFAARIKVVYEKTCAFAYKINNSFIFKLKFNKLKLLNAYERTNRDFSFICLLWHFP